MDSLPKWLSENYLYNQKDINIIKDNSDDPHTYINERELVTKEEDANLISSKFSEHPHELHKIFLDIDVEHHYTSSRTPGHGHIMLNVNVTRSELMLLHEFLVALGISGRGNQHQVTAEGQNFLRINTPPMPEAIEDPF